ncbi:MAG: hypothetical protein ACXVAX_02230 [Pseudobdellovibrio sp.]
MIKKIIYCLSILFFITGCSSAPVQLEKSKVAYNYKQLKLLEIDEMFSIIDRKMGQFKKTNNVDFVEQALQVALSRPDDDNVLEKTMAQIRLSSNPPEVWEQAVENLVDKAVTALNYPKTSAEDQVTYVVLLQNLLLDYRHDLLTLDESLKFERRMIRKVIDAHIIVSEFARKESSLNLSMHLRSPSEMGIEILKEAETSGPKSKKK